MIPPGKIEKANENPSTEFLRWRQGVPKCAEMCPNDELAEAVVSGDNALMANSPAIHSPASMRAQKRAVAGSSVLAAIAITTLKIVVGVTTGSLGILSEAAHSGLDLVAAIVTFLSVQVSDKPANVYGIP